MADIRGWLKVLYGISSYHNPRIEIDGWRFFMDLEDEGFFPVQYDSAVIVILRAWNPDSENHYTALAGLEGAVCRRRKGELSRGIDEAKFKRRVDLREFDPLPRIHSEILRTFHDLAAFVCTSEEIENPLEKKPLTLKDIQSKEKVPWHEGMPGRELRIIRHEDWSHSLQIATRYARYEPIEWVTIWTGTSPETALPFDAHGNAGAGIVAEVKNYSGPKGGRMVTCKFHSRRNLPDWIGITHCDVPSIWLKENDEYVYFYEESPDVYREKVYKWQIAEGMAAS